MSLNKVMLIGNVGQAPDVNQTDKGKVATFNLGITERYRSQDGERKENTEWIKIVAWRNTAEIIEKYVAKGSQLYVEGKIRTRSWSDNDGNKRYVTEVIADSVQMLGRKENGQQNAPQQTVPQHTTPIVDGVVEPQDDDLSF